MRRLLKNCDIVARDAGVLRLIKNGYLGIDGKYIDYLGSEKPAEHYDSEKDMKGAILMPAFVNAHGHASMTLMRGAGTGLRLQDWLSNVIFPIEAKLGPDYVRIGTLAAMLEMLACGTATFSEMYDFPYADAEAIAASGMKANISRVGLCFDENFDPRTDERLRECHEFVRALRGEMPANEECIKEIGGAPSAELMAAVNEGRIVPEICLHSEYLTKEGFVRACAEQAKELGTTVNIHVSETRQEHEECIERHGRTPIAYLADCGLLDSPTYAAHCVFITDEDMEIMKEKNVSLVHNPSSNLKLGSGIARIPEALKRGINVALGTDGAASNNNLNMMEEMHIAALLSGFASGDPAAVTTVQIIDMATINGARALGRSDAGILAPGMKADIAALSRDAAHMHPDLDTFGLLCYSAQISDVVMTMVDGRILYENGEYMTLDKEKILAELEKTVEKLFGM